MIMCGDEPPDSPASQKNKNNSQKLRSRNDNLDYNVYVNTNIMCT